MSTHPAVMDGLSGSSDSGALPEAGSVALVGAAKRYPGTTSDAVLELDLDIHPGEFFSLLGPSGSGKTTLLRMIAGFEYPTCGRVQIGGVDVTDLPAHKRPLHTVFQNYALFPHLDVYKNVAYPLRMQRLGKSQIAGRVTGILEKVSLGGFERRKPHQLSGGQRQRVALARALVASPEVVLLDEPLGALDLRLRQDMQIVLKQLQREFGTTFVYVTHDQGEALGMSDRIAILSDGLLHQVGSPEEIYFRPETPFVASFVGKSNLVTDPGKSDGSVSLRPESIVLGGAAPTRDQVVTGRIEEVLFQGSFVEVKLSTEFGDLLAHVPAQQRFVVGEGVQVGWNNEDMIRLVDPKG